MEKEIVTNDQSFQQNNNNKRFKVRTLLYVQHAITLSIIIIISFGLINYFYNKVETQHKRLVKYEEVNEITTDLRIIQVNLRRYASSKEESAKEECFKIIESSISKLEFNLDKLYIPYKQSPSLYFLYLGLKNGTLFLRKDISLLEREREEQNPEFFNHYTSMNTIIDYLLDYSSSKYISALVQENSEALAYEQDELKKLRAIIFAIIVIIFGIYIIIANRITAQLLGPIDILVDTASKITRGELYFQDIELKGPEEYVFLEKSMNEMKVSLINRLELMQKNVMLKTEINDKKLQTIKIKHELEVARFSSLQSQINPHFFFNTLNTLRMMCILEDATNSVELIEDFSAFFRYTLKHTEKVTIAQEVDFVEHYLRLQKARFQEFITFDIKVDPESKNMLIPPLIIQPLVENSIKHGLEKKENGGNISIDIIKDINRIVILIEDTGVGIEPDVIKRILNGKDDSHIGLINMRGRLDIFFNHMASLNIRRASLKNGGTIVTLTIPCVKEADNV